MHRIMAIGALVLSAQAYGGPIFIDRFEDEFLEEEFITSAGSTINATASWGSLDIGRLLKLNGSVIGDAFTAANVVLRSSETQAQFGLGGVLGGERLGHLEQVPGSPLTSRIGVDVFSGILSFSTAFGVRGDLDLTYDGGGQLNSDFTSLADGRFAFELLSFDLPNPSLPATVTVTSGKGTVDEISHSVTLSLSKSVEGTVIEFPFASFTGIDFSDIDVITLNLVQDTSALDAVDFAIGSFYVVPTPGALALGVIAGVAAYRRRR